MSVEDNKRFDFSSLLDFGETVRFDVPLSPSAPSNVSFMITRRQKEQLRSLGYSDDAIATMTPTEAHRTLDLSKK